MSSPVASESGGAAGQQQDSELKAGVAKGVQEAWKLSPPT